MAETEHEDSADQGVPHPHLLIQLPPRDMQRQAFEKEIAKAPTLNMPEVRRPRDDTYWSIPQALLWIQCQELEVEYDWDSVRADILYKVKPVRPGSAWELLHRTLVTGAITAFDGAGEPHHPAFWGRKDGVTRVMGDGSVLLAEEVRRLTEGRMSHPNACPSQMKLSAADTPTIRMCLQQVYKEHTAPDGYGPNVNDCIKPTQEKLKALGKRASKIRIQSIAEKPEFKDKRRRQGQRRAHPNPERKFDDI